MGRASGTSPGWFPDPFEDSRSFRWWNGSGWTTARAESLWEPDPVDPAPYVPPPSTSHGAAGSVDPFDHGPRTVEIGESRGRGLLVTATALAAVLMVSACVVWWSSVAYDRSAQPTAAGASQTDRTDQSRPVDDGSDQAAGPAGQPPGSHDVPGADGSSDRPTADGPLSFPDPGPAWRTAGDWVLREHLSRERGMVATTEPEYRPGRDWQASIVAGDLPRSISTDGSLRQVAERTTRWFTRSEWGAEPTADPVSEKIRVDGRPAWKVTTRVGYDIDGVQATYDDIEIVVVDYGPDQDHGLLIASVPNTDRQLWRDVDRIVAAAGRAAG